MIKEKGGSGKEEPHPRNMKKEEKNEPRIVKVEYIDPLLVKKSNPKKYRPSVRHAVGWRIDDPEDEWVMLMSDLPVSHQPFEKLRPEVAFLIPKTSVLAVWDLSSQNLRSGINQ